LRSKSENQL
jgi:hypothetical protein